MVLNKYQYEAQESRHIPWKRIQKAMPGKHGLLFASSALHSVRFLAGLMPFQGGEHVIEIDEIQDGGGGDGEQNAQDAKHFAAHQDGHHDEQAGHAQGLAKQLGLDDIAVDGLQDQGKDNEDQGADGWASMDH